MDIKRRLVKSNNVLLFVFHMSLARGATPFCIFDFKRNAPILVSNIIYGLISSAVLILVKRKFVPYESQSKT